VEAPLQVLALGDELREPLALPVDLLLRERVDGSDTLESAARALQARCDLVAPLSLVGLRLAGELPQRFQLGRELRELDLERGRPLARLGGLPPQLGLGASEPPELGADLSHTRHPRVYARPK